MTCPNCNGTHHVVRQGSGETFPCPVCTDPTSLAASKIPPLDFSRAKQKRLSPTAFATNPPVGVKP